MIVGMDVSTINIITIHIHYLAVKENPFERNKRRKFWTRHCLFYKSSAVIKYKFQGYWEHFVFYFLNIINSFARSFGSVCSFIPSAAKSTHLLE